LATPARPRTVRLRAAAALWWPFGLVTGAAFALVTIAIVVLLAIGGGGLPFADARLDANPALAAHDARVTAVEPTSFHCGARAVDVVHYDYQLADTGSGSDVCYAWSGTFATGQPAALELLADAPAIHRLRRSNRALSSFWLPDLAGFLWLPLAALFGY